MFNFIFYITNLETFFTTYKFYVTIFDIINLITNNKINLVFQLSCDTSDSFTTLKTTKHVETWTKVIVSNDWTTRKNFQFFEFNIFPNFFDPLFIELWREIKPNLSLKIYEKVPLVVTTEKLMNTPFHKLTLQDILDCFVSPLQSTKTYYIDTETQARIFKKLNYTTYFPEIVSNLSQEEFKEYNFQLVSKRFGMLVDEEMIDNTLENIKTRELFLETLTNNPINSRLPQWSLLYEHGKLYLLENGAKCPIWKSEKVYAQMNAHYFLEQYRTGIKAQNLQFLGKDNYLSIPVPCDLLIREPLTGKMYKFYFDMDLRFQLSPEIKKSALEILRIVSHDGIFGIDFYHLKGKKEHILQPIISGMVDVDDLINNQRPFSKSKIIKSQDLLASTLNDLTWYLLSKFEAKPESVNKFFMNRLQIWNLIREEVEMWYHLENYWKGNSDAEISLLAIKNNEQNFIIVDHLFTPTEQRNPVAPHSAQIAMVAFSNRSTEVINELPIYEELKQSNLFTTGTEFLKSQIINIDPVTGKKTFTPEAVNFETLLYLAGVQPWTEPNPAISQIHYFHWPPDIQSEFEMSPFKFSKYGPQPPHLYVLNEYEITLTPADPLYYQAKNDAEFPFTWDILELNECSVSLSWLKAKFLYDHNVRVFPITIIDSIRELQLKESITEKQLLTELELQTSSEAYFNKIQSDWEKELEEDRRLSLVATDFIYDDEKSKRFAEQLEKESKKSDIDLEIENNQYLWPKPIWEVLKDDFGKLVKYVVKFWKFISKYISKFILDHFTGVSYIFLVLILIFVIPRTLFITGYNLMMALWVFYEGIIRTVGWFTFYWSYNTWRKEYLKDEMNCKREPYDEKLKFTAWWEKIKLSPFTEIVGKPLGDLSDNKETLWNIPDWGTIINQIYRKYTEEVYPREKFVVDYELYLGNPSSDKSQLKDKEFRTLFKNQLLYSAVLYTYLIEDVKIEYDNTNERTATYGRSLKTRLEQFDENFLTCEMNNFELRDRRLIEIFEFIFQSVVLKHSPYPKILVAEKWWYPEDYFSKIEYEFIKEVANYLCKNWLEPLLLDKPQVKIVKIRKIFKT